MGEKKAKSEKGKQYGRKNKGDNKGKRHKDSSFNNTEYILISGSMFVNGRKAKKKPGINPGMIFVLLSLFVESGGYEIVKLFEPGEK